MLSEEDARRAVEHGEHGQVALRRLRECAVQRGHSRAVDLVRVRVRVGVRVRVWFRFRLERVVLHHVDRIALR